MLWLVNRVALPRKNSIVSAYISETILPVHHLTSVYYKNMGYWLAGLTSTVTLPTFVPDMARYYQIRGIIFTFTKFCLVLIAISKVGH